MHAHRCVEEAGEEQVHGWALVEVVVSQGKGEGLRTCDSRFSASQPASLVVGEEGEVQEWELLEQLLELLDEQTCQHRPMAEVHQTWVEEVTALAQGLSPCRTVSELEGVGGRLFSEPVAQEDLRTRDGHRAAAVVVELGSFVLRFRLQLALA